MAHKVQNSSNSSDTPSVPTDETSSLLIEPVADKALAWISNTSRIRCSAKSVNALRAARRRCISSRLSQIPLSLAAAFGLVQKGG